MKMAQETSILTIAQIMGKTIQDILARSARMQVAMSKTAQMLQSLQMCEDISAFVSFYGSYNGILVMNFHRAAAVEIVANSFRTMGLPEAEIPKHHMSESVRSSLGELLNQIIGGARATIQSVFDLTAEANIPAVVPITTPIGLVFKSSTIEQMPCCRLSFLTDNKNRFHMDLTIEPTLFVPLK